MITLSACFLRGGNSDFPGSSIEKCILTETEGIKGMFSKLQTKWEKGDLDLGFLTAMSAFRALALRHKKPKNSNRRFFTFLF